MPFWFEVLVASVGSDQGMAVPMAISVAVADFGCRGRLQRPEKGLQQEQTSVINTVYRQWKTLLAVSLTPANSLSPVSLTPVNNLWHRR
jgi:hypothetical protein